MERTTRHRCPRGDLARRGARAALALGALTLLAACGEDTGSTQPLPAPDSLPTYADVRQDVLIAVQDVAGDDGWSDDGAATATGQEDGRCVVALPDARTTRADAAGYDQLEQVPDAIGPALTDHGFGEPSDVVHPEHGGSAYVEAKDPAGWTVTVTADGDLLRLDVSGPVDLDPCDEAQLPELG